MEMKKMLRFQRFFLLHQKHIVFFFKSGRLVQNTLNSKEKKNKSITRI